MNVLLINADQLRHDCVGYAGIRDVKTPNIDALAREGIAYTSAYTPLPVCSPARQALLCGRRPDSFGAQWNYDFMPTPELDPNICWTKALSERGSYLGYIGRFHVSATKKPCDFGYNDYVNRREYTDYISRKYPNVVYEGGWLGCESPIPHEDSETQWYAERAAEMLNRCAESGKQWLMWVDFEVPHLPCRPSQPYSRMYNPADIPEWDGFGDTFENKPYIHRQQTVSWGTDKMTWSDFQPMVARYYGWITQLDEAIGCIIDALKATGQYDDTAIIFTSDHGDMCGSHNMLDKHYVLYDDIIRVPLIMRIPNVTPCVTDEFVMNCLDIPATIRELTGLPSDPTAHGKPLPLNGNGNNAPNEVFVTSNGQQFGLYTTRALRTKTHKYVWNLTDVDEFYDLTLDKGEKVNRIACPEYYPTIQSMRRRLAELLIASGDRFARSSFARVQLLEDRKHIPNHIKEEIQ